MGSCRGITSYSHIFNKVSIWVQAVDSVMEMRVWGSGHWILRTWSCLLCLQTPPTHRLLHWPGWPRTLPPPKGQRSPTLTSHSVVWAKHRASYTVCTAFILMQIVPRIFFHCYLQLYGLFWRFIMSTLCMKNKQTNEQTKTQTGPLGYIT